MRACVRNNDGTCAECFVLAEGLCQGCGLSPLLFSILFATVLLIALQRLSEDADILADFVHPQEKRARVGPEAGLECVRRAMWGVLYDDDVCIISQSSLGLELMRTVLIGVFSALRLTVSEKKTNIMCLPNPHMPAITLVFNTSGQQYR